MKLRELPWSPPPRLSAQQRCKGALIVDGQILRSGISRLQEGVTATHQAIERVISGPTGGR